MSQEYRNGKYRVYRTGERIIIETGGETYAIESKDLEERIPRQSLQEIRRLSQLTQICSQFSRCEFSDIPIVREEFCYRGGGCPETLYPIAKELMKDSLKGPKF